jgi:hypothetical protein
VDSRRVGQICGFLGCGGRGEVEDEVEVEDGRRCAPLNESESEVEDERAAQRLETLNSQLKTENC